MIELSKDIQKLMRDKDITVTFIKPSFHKCVVIRLSRGDRRLEMIIRPDCISCYIKKMARDDYLSYDFAYRPCGHQYNL